jgi:hypothetical protein
MIGVQVFLYPPLITLPGAIVLIAEPIILLFAYTLSVHWLTSRANQVTHRTALVVGAQIGLIAAVLEITHIMVENFARLSPHAQSVSTLAFMIGLFLVWGLAGYLGGWRTGAPSPGLLAACWSAMLGMLLTMTFGFSQLFWSLQRLEQRNNGSPDFLRSGWTDMHAFTIADLFEAGAKILLIAPILATICGGVGAFLGSLSARFGAERSSVQ